MIITNVRARGGYRGAVRRPQGKQPLPTHRGHSGWKDPRAAQMSAPEQAQPRLKGLGGPRCDGSRARLPWVSRAGKALPVWLLELTRSRHGPGEVLFAAPESRVQSPNEHAHNYPGEGRGLSRGLGGVASLRGGAGRTAGALERSAVRGGPEGGAEPEGGTKKFCSQSFPCPQPLPGPVTS